MGRIAIRCPVDQHTGGARVVRGWCAGGAHVVRRRCAGGRARVVLRRGRGGSRVVRRRSCAGRATTRSWRVAGAGRVAASRCRRPTLARQRCERTLGAQRRCPEHDEMGSRARSAVRWHPSCSDRPPNERSQRPRCLSRAWAVARRSIRTSEVPSVRRWFGRARLKRASRLPGPILGGLSRSSRDGG